MAFVFSKRKPKPLAQWRIQARKAAKIAKTGSYSMGGLPRQKQPKTISLPTLKFMQKEEI